MYRIVAWLKAGHIVFHGHSFDLLQKRNDVLIEILPSDIVGFTAMAAKSSPMQVGAGKISPIIDHQ